MNFDGDEFRKRVKVITMEEFIKREGGPDGRLPVPEDRRKSISASADHCERMVKSKFCQKDMPASSEVSFLLSF